MTAPEKVVWVCLHALVILVPLAVSNPSVIGINAAPFTYDQFDIVKVFVMRAIVLVAGAAWLWGLLTKGARVRTVKVGWLVLVFLAWVALTSVLSVHPPTAIFGKYRRFEGLLSFLTYGATFFLALQVVDRPSRIRSLARSLVIGGALVAGYGVAQRLGLDPASWGTLPFEERRAFSTFGNPDLLGGYLIFPLAISLGLALSEEKEWPRVTSWAAFLLIGVCLLVSYVRGAWIGGVVALGAVAAAAVVARAPFGAVDWGAVGLAGAAAVVETVRSLSSSSEVTNVIARILSIFKFNEGSSLTRFQIWQAALGAIKERPIFGWGPDTFRLLFPKFKPRAYTKAAGYLSVADNVHDYPLQLASAIGIPGMLMFYGLIVWSLATSFTQVFVRGKGTERLVLAGFWAAVAGYVVHLFFGLSVTGSTIFLWLSLGVLLSPGATVREVKAPSWGVFPAVVAAALAAVLFVGNIVYVRADNYYLKARIFSSGMQRVENAKKAVELNPYNDMYRSEVGLAWQDMFIGMLSQGINDQQSRNQALEYLGQAEQALIDVIDYVPMEYDNYVFLANLYNQAAYYVDPVFAKNAVEVAERGKAIEPFGPAIRLQLAVGYMHQEDYEKAIAEAKSAVDMDPAYTDGWVMLGDANRLAGHWEAARDAYKTALAQAPGRTDVQQSLAAVEASLTAESTTTP
ncbi:MAG: O-antigen ligase family protein [Actinomycetia bacterium]|nr:O-antigen ligase family protein [Actinomycetes bacterium]